MLYTHEELLKLIHDTKAVSIWDHTKGPVFWYAANIPGPFYVNTEMVIGSDLSEKLLSEMTAIVATTADLALRAAKLNDLILEAYHRTASWQRLIKTMIDKAGKEFPSDSYQAISGGERRDWLFSIPFAEVSHSPHLFLFKNKGSFCVDRLETGQSVLHVSDLINNAASFLDLWQPILSSLHLKCVGNLCLTVRGSHGITKLRDIGQRVVSFITINEDFFRHLHAIGLINTATSQEMDQFFGSSQAWANTYLMGKPELFDVMACDAKSFARLSYFIQNDPWHLRSTHEIFFKIMEDAIRSRQSKAA